jgi:hypothetical protein
MDDPAPAGTGADGGPEDRTSAVEASGFDELLERCHPGILLGY